MSAVGSLRVELEFVDGSFTTKVVRAGTTLQQLEQQTGRTVAAVRRLESSTAEVGRVVTGFTTTVGLADAALRNLYTVFAGWAVEILKTSAAMERLTVQLTNMSSAASEVERAVEGQQLTRYLQDLAQSAPFALRDLSGAFVRLRSGGLEPTTTAMNALVNAVAASGGSAVQLERASIAIQQMSGKGVLSMEELRQQLGEAVPRAMPLLARSMGMAMSDLVKEISEGRVRAAPALQAMLAEFERTFGSSAVTMMQTLSGQVQVLQTNFQRFQLAAAGPAGSGGFLDASTNAVRRLNELLSSSDAQGFAIRLNVALTDATNGLVRMGEWVIRNIDTIATLAQVIGGVLLVNIARWLTLTAVSQLAPITLAITAMARSVAGLAAAMGLLSVSSGAALGTFAAGVAASAASWRALGATIAGIGAAALAAGGTVVGAFASITAAVTTATLATSTFVRTLFTAGAAAAFAPIAAGAVNLANAIGVAGAALATRLLPALTATGTAAQVGRLALIGLGATGGVVVGIMAIGAAITQVRSLYRWLTEDAGAAYRRLQQGANDTATVITARAEADNLAASAARAERNVARLRELQNAPERRQRIASLDEVRGFGVMPDFAAQSVNRAGLTQALEQQESMLAALRRQIADRRIQAEGAEARRYIAEGETQAQNIVQALQRQFQTLRLAYDTEQSRLQAQLDGVANERDRDGNLLTREAREERIVEIRRQQADSRVQLERDLLARLEAARDKAAQEGAAAQNRRDEAAVQQSVATIRKLEDEIKAANERLALATSDVRGAALGFASGQQDQFDRQAQTMLTNMRARIAEMNGEMQNTGSNLSRINSLIEQNRLGELAETMKRSMREAAVEMDATEAAFKRFNAAQVAIGNIDTGLARQQAEAQSYADTIGGGALQGALSQFLQFQRQMQAELAKVTAGMSAQSEAAMAAAGKVAQAVSLARSNMIDGLENQYRNEENAARLRELTGAAREAERRRQISERRNIQRTALTNEMNALAESDAAGRARIAALIESNRRLEQMELRASNAVGGRANAAAGQASLNIIQQMQRRLAELSATAEGTGTNIARVEELISQGKLGGGMAEQARELATRLDETEKAAERTRAALSRYDSVVRGMGDLRERAQEALARGADASLPEFSRRFEALRRENVRLEAELRARGQASQANDLRDNLGPERLRLGAQEIVGNRVADMNEQTREINAQLASTAAERRRIAEENITIEQEQFRRILDIARVEGAERTRIEEAVAANITARREQLARQTEGATAQMMRNWGDRLTAMDQAGARFMEDFVDKVAEGIATGKFSFEDMSKSFIKELIKIELRFAASKIWEMLRGVGGAGGAGGLVGILGSVLSGVFGATTSVGASDGMAAANVMAPTQHTGGIVGRNFTEMRAVNSAIFAGAPRFHKGGFPGLRSDEIPTILQKGEGVFTAEQMKALGGMMYPDMRAVSAPTQSAPPVTVNVNNQSGQDMDAMAGSPRFDGEGWVIDVVLKNMQRPGALRDAVRSGR